MHCHHSEYKYIIATARMRGSLINAADLVGRSPALVCSYTLGWKDLINAADQLVGSSSCLQLHWDGAQCNDRLYIDLVLEHFIVISNPDHKPRHEEFHQTRTCRVSGAKAGQRELRSYSA